MAHICRVIGCPRDEPRCCIPIADDWDNRRYEEGVNGPQTDEDTEADRITHTPAAEDAHAPAYGHRDGPWPYGHPDDNPIAYALSDPDTDGDA